MSDPAMTARPFGRRGSGVVETWLAGAAVAWLVLAPVASAQEAVRVGVLELDEIVGATTAGRELRAGLEALAARTRATEEGLLAERSRLRRRLDEAGASVAAVARADLESRLAEVGRALERLGEDREIEAGRLEEAAYRSVETEIQPVFETLHREYGYDLILGRSPAVVLIVDEQADITELALRLLAELREPLAPEAGDGPSERR